jgi:hypothetical protein
MIAVLAGVVPFSIIKITVTGSLLGYQKHSAWLLAEQTRTEFFLELLALATDAHRGEWRGGGSRTALGRRIIPDHVNPASG